MIIGIDEVGRGCWAGPLVAGAVALPADFAASDTGLWKLTDSKQLSKRQRETADRELRNLGVDYGLGWVSAEELDAIGMTRAVTLAMRRAYLSLSPDNRMVAADVILDGSINFLTDVPRSQAVVKADGSVAAVSAASVIAKVARDSWMQQAALRHPGYGFDKHVGYGTAQHRQALARLGVCELHRRSFKPIKLAFSRSEGIM